MTNSGENARASNEGYMIEQNQDTQQLGPINHLHTGVPANVGSHMANSSLTPSGSAEGSNEISLTSAHASTLDSNQENAAIRLHCTFNHMKRIGGRGYGINRYVGNSVSAYNDMQADIKNHAGHESQLAMVMQRWYSVCHGIDDCYLG
ncbi:hypothetical protein F4811DRAFT_191165 [Daldinia bambusicola]|nr:hypothetical protein F4811DRAFT_191165 [Daldinia bambusicola]